jgi:hypothetical protein
MPRSDPPSSSSDKASRTSERRPASRDPAERLADDRDARVVGSNEDNVLDSMGKAIVSPVASADDDAERPEGTPEATADKGTNPIHGIGSGKPRR